MRALYIAPYCFYHFDTVGIGGLGPGRMVGSTHKGSEARPEWSRLTSFVFKTDYSAVICRILSVLVDFFVSFVAAHFADGVLEHDVLLEEVVDSFFALGVVVHRALEEEAQEALDAEAAGASGEVAEQYQVEA